MRIAIGVVRAILEVVVTTTLSCIVGVFFAFGLHPYALANYNTIDAFPLSVRLLLFQAFPCFLVTVCQLRPFYKNFPKIFHAKDKFSWGIVVFSAIYCFSFNSSIVFFRNSIIWYDFSKYFRFGYGLLLVCFPLLCRWRLYFAHKTLNAANTSNGRLSGNDGSLAEFNECYQIFTNDTPVGFTVTAIILWSAAGLYYFELGFWSVPITYIILLFAMYYFYRDFKTMSDLQKTHSVGTLTPLSQVAQRFRPNFWYCVAHGAAFFVLIVLAQVYVNTLCAFSKSPWSECISYYAKRDPNLSTYEQLFIKISFRFWASLVTTFLEIGAIFAYKDGNYLHNSYFWRHSEDLVVSIGFVTTDSVSVIVILAVINQIVMIVKARCRFHRRHNFLVTHKSLPYSRVHTRSNTLSVVEEVRNQAIRAKLNYVSRLSAITTIGTIAMVNWLSGGSENVWEREITSKVVIMVTVIFLQIIVTRWVILVIYQWKKRRVLGNSIVSNSTKKVDNVDFEINDWRVIANWKRYLFITNITAMFLVIVDIKHIPL
ncbi:hypothetical protein BKA69DRAFT_1061788 [Paraphysoderma sedebokerense]|nr:hypothetical protein BKA69DRAFT_1061788 [Paraphysoderma sedebokerense]